MKGSINSVSLSFVEPAGQASADGSCESSRLTRPCLRPAEGGSGSVWLPRITKYSVSCAYAGVGRQSAILNGAVGERG